MKRLIPYILIPLIVGLFVAGGAWKVSMAVDDYVKPTLQEMGWIERP